MLQQLVYAYYLIINGKSSYLSNSCYCKALISVIFIKGFVKVCFIPFSWMCG